MSQADKPASDATTNDTSLIGRQIGKYEIIGMIARGGMGTVYEARHKGIGKRVAVKVIDGELSRSKDAVTRFQREAEAASAVDSAHIVTIFDSGTTDEGLPFLVMELLRGEDLGHRMKEQGRLEIKDALSLIAQLLRGLCRAHEAGIVHRDLKPDNIFVTSRDDETDFVKILDFGISKMRRVGTGIESTITRQGTVLGTPLYMSPEQAQAAPDIDERTDLWSVGAILYQCLTGRPPHEGHAYEAVIVNICTKDADDVRFLNPEVPEPIARFVAKALTRDRTLRFQSAREMLDALRDAAGELLAPSATKLGKQETTTRTALSSSPGTPRAHSGQTPAEAAPSGTSRVGWSTTGGASSGKPRARFAAIGVAAAALIAIIAVLSLRTETTTQTTTQTSTPAAPATPATHTAEPSTPKTHEAPTNTGSSAAEATASQSAPAPEPERSTVAAQTKKAPPATSAKAEEAKPVQPASSASAKAKTTNEAGIAPQLKLKSE